ncbi:MAG: PD40 domain-containing protein [Acidobacteria bacterium]|nr:PD40 domain-containing protein [Acidobacteriota bacterium]
MCLNSLSAFGAQEPAETLRDQIGKIVVTPGNGPGMAVLDFGSNNPGATGHAGQFSSTLLADLEFSGVVNILGKSFYPSLVLRDPKEIKFEEWGRDPLKADYIVFGSLLVSGDNLVVEVYLYDVQAKNKLLASRYRTTTDQLRSSAHKAADEIVKLLTGQDGIASSRIAYVSRRGKDREINLMDYDGAHSQGFSGTGGLHMLPSASLDGQRLAYLQVQNGKSGLQIRALKDKALLGTIAFSRGTVSSPVFSPDGASLAFASSKDGSSYQIYVTELGSGKVRRLTTLGSVIHTSPRWNPRTGREIAFISDRSGSPQIYVMDADGGNVRQLLTQGGSADSPSWSPDGRYLAFAWRPQGASRYDIYLMDIATQQIVQLTQSAGSNESPSWSPDGRHIAFQSNRSGQSQIYLMHIDGTGVRAITNQGGSGPCWLR